MVGYNAPHVRQAADALVALVNTRPHAYQGDTLVDGSAVDEVVTTFAPEGSTQKSVDLESVIRLREAIARTLEDGGAGSDGAWADVSSLIKSTTVRRSFTPSGVTLEPAAGDPVLCGIATAIHNVRDADCWTRLRLCAYRPCNRAFFDTTRSRTQRWHSYEVCGNRANVSAYRARVKQGEGA